MDWHIIYAKFDGCKGFRAFDINEGRQVGNLIYASLVENTEDTRLKLQELADLNKECHLVLQLRRKGRVCFQTKEKVTGRPTICPQFFFLWNSQKTSNVSR